MTKAALLLPSQSAKTPLGSHCLQQQVSTLRCSPCSQNTVSGEQPRTGPALPIPVPAALWHRSPAAIFTAAPCAPCLQTPGQSKAHPTAGLVICLRLNPKARIVSNIPLSHHTWCSTAGGSVPSHGDAALRCWPGSILPALVLHWECLGPLPEASRRRTAPGSRQRQHSSCSQSREQHGAMPVACTHPKHSFTGREGGSCSLTRTLRLCSCWALLSLCPCQQRGHLGALQITPGRNQVAGHGDPVL